MELSSVKVGDVWYRYRDQLRASLDEYGELDTSFTWTEIVLNRYIVTRITPCGVKIVPEYALNSNWLDTRDRFVRCTARKMYAHPNKDDALKSFIARKQSQAKIHKARYDRAQSAIRAAAYVNTRPDNDGET